ncbi:MAG: methionine--tRNA ligase subunit beta [Planctomycetota bacterium]
MTDPKPTIEFPDFLKLDLRVATITQAEEHPNADRLLKLKVDLGSETRQICAGIKAYYADPAELVGKQIVVVANLAPRTIRGEESNGMLLAASAMTPDAQPDDKPQDVVLITPGKPVPPGSSVG